jgi:putative ABC transport system permease protein
MITFKDVFRQLLRDLRAEKLRTFLTVFGIVWGTVAISLMLAFGTGLHQHLIVQTAGLGDRIVIAWPSATSIPFQGLGKGRRIRATDEDIAFIQAQVRNLRGICGEYETNLRVDYNTKNLSVDTAGINAGYGRMRNQIAAQGGRFINDVDVNDQRRVAFLGNKLSDDLFGSSDAVGKTILVNHSPFLIIGVLQKKQQDSNYSGPDDQKMYIPASTYRALTGEKYVSDIVFQAESTADTKKVIDDVRAALAKKMRFDPTDKEALSAWDTTEQFKFFDNFMLAFNGFLGIIGLLTLVVGGIGVSNIMNVVVEERTREIGIKMALGAKQRWILTQFLMETMLVTAIGGAIGFALSIGICAVFPKAAEEFVGHPSVSPVVALLTALSLGLVGLIAGYFPARDASRLDPVVAMKL